MEEEAEYQWMWKVGSEAHLGSLEVDLASAGRQKGSLKWPPRSYWCSFCCRELRSAQALGGHMNAHRRDRAKLNKHSAISHNENCNLDHIPTRHCKSRHNLITQVVASPPSPSSTGSGFEGEQVLKKQKLCVGFTMQISTEKEGEQDSDSFKQDLQTETVDLDLELRL